MNDKSLRVLIIEDSKDDLLLTIRELKKGGYNPVCERVETAAAMEKALKEKQWDIILCDYKMPKFNAPSAIAILKKAKLDIPIIVLTGAIGEETAVECMRLGAQDYIMKGNMSRLCSVIARELEDAEVRNKEKYTGKKLRYEEERFRALAENSSDIIVVVNREGIITYENPAVERILGFKLEERIGAGRSENLHPDDTKHVTDSFNTLFGDKNAPAQQSEVRLRHRDGSWRNFEAIASHLVHDNVVEAIIVNLRDITERKRAKEELRESEDRLRREKKFRQSLIDTSPAFIVAIGSDGQTLMMNQSLLETLEYTKEEIKGADYLTTFVPEEDRLKLAEVFQNIIREGKSTVNKNRIISRSGRIYLVEWHGRPVSWEDRDGNFFVGVGIDITARNQMEKELRQSEEKYRNIVEDIQEGYFELDLAGNYTFANDAECRNIGYSREELIGMNNRQYQDETTVQKMYQRFRRLYKTGEPIKVFDIEIIRKNRTKAFNEISASLIRDAEGKPIGFRGISRDITDRKHAEEQLLQTLNRLKKAVGTTIQVLGTASEARDPYTSGHQKRVADLARAIATEMGLPQDTIEGIRMTGSIHDIGKLSIPAEILVKPTKLTNIEFSLIKEHAKSGYEMLKDVDSPWPLAEIVYQHHERMNGTGYPRNLKGDDILIEARIMAVADVVEAMASHRPYRPSLGIEVALEEIEKNKGILYDDTVADTCLKLFREKGYQFT